ncbi:P-loop ATPase, Sll1717 family [Alcaligenes faecalis]|uniref:P-loop ATPase, Sll1717 family n=1 Tax=Alcaligenes faecalis TaxID=511 RepID=UPI0024BCC332|nr:DNA repair protein [Alcaligenes faecalis]WHQ45343.1 DNA repair protein [Alcaligenes faecalis]
MKSPSNVYQSGIQFRFKKGDSIGELDAENDDLLLSECFVDTGDYDTLTDCSKPQCVVVGRTGSGKSALLKRVSQYEERVIEIVPENLSLQYICNSDIITSLEAAGAKLDIFYNLLWRHVLSTELLKYHFKLSTEEKTKNWLRNILPSLREKNQAKERAIKYINEWGDKFWQETEYRVKEITQKLENDINAELGVGISTVNLSTAGRKREELEKITEVVNKAQKVINNIQIKSLSDVMHYLNEDVFNDKKVKTYVVIDRLDEGWAPDKVRYKLIRSLIETLKNFRGISSVKILIAMRRDLLETVFLETRDAGFQEEKYESLFVGITWTKGQLRELLDKRIRQLVKARYTGSSLGINEIFPRKVGHIDFLDYLATRTLYRPRDAIAFVNECLVRSEGKQAITATIIQQAEIEYSTKRVRALEFEWATHYPKLLDYFSLIERLPDSFKISSIPKDKVEAYALSHMDNINSNDPLDRASIKFINGGSIHVFTTTLVRCLYHIGVIGIKTDSFSPIRWSYMEAVSPSEGQIKPSSTIYIHPMIWSRVGTLTKR